MSTCYLVHGGEPLQTEEIIAALTHSAAKEGYTNRVVFDLTTQFNWEDLLNKCLTLDLFAERTLLELRLPGETVNKQANTNLEQLLLQQDSNLYIIIRANKLKSQTLNSNWVKHIQQKGKIYQAKPIPTQQWPMWLKKRLNDAGFSLSNEALELMARCYEGNLIAATQCIKRLSAAFNAGKIELNQLTPFLDDNSSYSIFELTNAALSGDAARTYRILQSVQNEGTEPILVLWSLTKEIRTLIAIKNDVKIGVDFANSAQKHGIWRESLPRIKEAIARLSINKLQNLLHLAKSIDTIIKGMQPGNTWEHLFSLCLILAGKEFLTTKELCL